MNWDKLFWFNWKRGLGCIGAFAFLIVFHNVIHMITALFIDLPEGYCDPITFCMAFFGVPAYGLFCIGYTVYKKIKNR